MSDTTPEQPTVSPQVTTRSPWHVSHIPAHLGRARTSTVVLAVLFVAIFALYLTIKPNPPGTAPTGGGGPLPAVTTAPARPTSTTTTARPTTPQTTQQRPTTTAPATSTEAPTGTTTQSLPGDSNAPTTTPSLPSPTASAPTG